MDEGGNVRDDMKLPSGTDEAERLAGQLKDDFAEGKELIVSVLCVSDTSFGISIR